MDFATASKLTEDDARAYLEKLRWDGQPFCAHCACLEVTKLNGKATRPGVYKCRGCRKQFTVTVGTIFERSHIELRQWVMAFCLVCSSKKGISAHQLYRMLGLGSYKSAWHMAHRIRHAMQNEPLNGMMLKGEVEADETWIGGKLKGKGKGPRIENKTAVMALIQRDGDMRTRAIKRVTRDNLKTALVETVDRSAALYTDENQCYKKVGKRFFGGHHTVNHSKGEYARGRAHCNHCESFFALLKRGVHGTFHHVSEQHLQRYADEFAFRWNHRDRTDGYRTEMALRAAPGCRLIYEQK